MSLKILCFPHAGAGASCYRCWCSGLPPGCEVVPVCLPGREGRFAAALPETWDELLSDVATQVAGVLDGPYAILGHSLGALIGFELARYLRRGGLEEPVHLFVSAFRAPHLALPKPAVNGFSDLALKARIRRWRGTPREVMQDDELLRLLLPILRADLRLCQAYRWRAEPPLACPISCFGGRADAELRAEELQAWRVQTRASFRLHLMPGDHFFLYPARKIVLAKMLADVDFRGRFAAKGGAMRTAGPAPPALQPLPGIAGWGLRRIRTAVSQPSIL